MNNKKIFGIKVNKNIRREYILFKNLKMYEKII